MPDIFHHFPINASIEKVFEKISTPDGLNVWWSKISTGIPATGNTYEFDFGPGYIWKALVSKYNPFNEFELKFTDSDADWNGSKVGFKLIDRNKKRKFIFTIPVGKNSTNIIGSPTIAGPCTCEY